MQVRSSFHFSPYYSDMSSETRSWVASVGSAITVGAYPIAEEGSIDPAELLLEAGIEAQLPRPMPAGFEFTFNGQH